MLDMDLGFHRVKGVEITTPRKIGENSYTSEIMITTRLHGENIVNHIDLFSDSGEALSDIRIENREGK